MSLDLEERLAAYQPTLEAAISERAAHPVRQPVGGRRRGWLVGAVAAAAVCAAAIGWVALGTAPAPDGTSPADGPAPEPPTEVTAPVPTTAPPSAPRTTQVNPIVPAVTAPSPTPPATMLPSAVPPVIAIGDSVMLGAAANLSERGIIVDAHESRQVVETVPLMEALRDLGRLGDAVVVHLGNNGPPNDETLDAFFASLADVPKVVVLTARADRSWIAETNDNLTEAAERFPNIELLDWATLADQCPGDCFYDDGIHLKPAGRAYYTQLIVDALND